jgi:acetyl-CoA carboxylase beta subunit
MSWVSFISGGFTVLFAYALFSSNRDDEVEEEHDESDTDLVVNGPAGRHVMLSCQTCRKLKRHKEIEKDLYQCTKCKRQVDLRRAS